MESSSSKYFSRLDHLRLLAALMVLFWHAMRYKAQVPTSEIPAFWPFSFLQEGHTGVALFMTLSGYIFWLLCSDREIDYASFIKNRILRIAPLFLFWMFFYFYTQDIDPVKLFLATASLLNNHTVPGNAWTIVVELQFYLLFPILLLFSRTYGLRYLFGFLIFAAFFRWTVWLTNGTVEDLAYSTIFGRIDQFLLGMIACDVANRHKELFRSLLLFGSLIALWILVFHLFDASGGYFDGPGGYPSTSSVWVYWPLLEGLFYGLLTASYLSVRIPIPRRVDYALAWMGALSYSLYLNQATAILIADKAFERMGLETAGFYNALAFGALGVFPILLGISVMTYYLIERPFLLLRKPYLLPARATKS